MRFVQYSSVRFPPIVPVIQSSSRSLLAKRFVLVAASLADTRLVAQHSVVADHPDDHRGLWQHIHLGCSAGLIGGRVYHYGLTDMPRAIRIVHRPSFIAQPISQSIAIVRAAGCCVKYLALDFMGSLRYLQTLRQPPSAFTCAAEVQQEQDDTQNSQRFARRAAGEDGGDPAHYRCPRFQSSIRAWTATAMPISATAMNT
jgi:hypothetical protein